MALWLVRAGRAGERENLALENNLVAIGWDEMPDLGPSETREGIMQLAQAAYPDAKMTTLHNWVGQLNSFRFRIQPGDIVALPLKQQAAIAFGEVVGDYEHRPDLPYGAAHARAVRWIRKDVPRAAIDVEIVATYELYGINRHKLENLLHRILAPGKPSMTITGPFGHKLSPREWFIVPLDVISEIVDRIRDGSITDYKYDPTKAKLVMGSQSG